MLFGSRQRAARAGRRARRTSQGVFSPDKALFCVGRAMDARAGRHARREAACVAGVDTRGGHLPHLDRGQRGRRRRHRGEGPCWFRRVPPGGSRPSRFPREGDGGDGGACSHERHGRPGLQARAPRPLTCVWGGLCICLDTSAGPEPSYRAYQMSRSTKASEPKAHAWAVRLQVTGAEVRHACQVAGLHDDVMSLPVRSPLSSCSLTMQPSRCCTSLTSCPSSLGEP